MPHNCMPSDKVVNITINASLAEGLLRFFASNTAAMDRMKGGPFILLSPESQAMFISDQALIRELTPILAEALDA